MEPDILARIDAVRWGDVVDAYGPAVEVPSLLAALVIGGEGARREAWRELWGRIVHQGTIYEATVHAVPVLLALARSAGPADRVEALRMLRDIGAAPGVSVWRFGDRGRPVSLDAEQERLLVVLRELLDAGAEELLARWRDEPEAVRRGLLWLLTALPAARVRHGDLVSDLLPDEHRTGWDVAVRDAPRDQAEADALYAFEDWVTLAG